MGNYRTVVEQYKGEIEEKKSRFIGQLIPVTSEAEAKEALNKIKKSMHDARHHCSAYRLEGEQLLERYSDDGEPAGTAGMPMLEVLRGNELVNVLAVVTRYFGGTKLGTGGLVRAYTKATQETLVGAEIVVKGLYVQFDVTVPYTLSGKVDYYIQSQNLLQEEIDYGEGVRYSLYTPKLEYENRCREFIELCNDQCEIMKITEVTGYVGDGRFIANI